MLFCKWELQIIYMGCNASKDQREEKRQKRECGAGCQPGRNLNNWSPAAPDLPRAAPPTACKQNAQSKLGWRPQVWSSVC